jgi:hypothetical protein
MRRIITLLATVLLGNALADDPALSLADALEQKRVALEATGNGRDTITIKLTAAANTVTTVAIPAGTRFASDRGEAQISLGKLEAKVAPNSETEAILPAAALSTKNSASQRAVKLAPLDEPRLAALIAFFAHQPDLPRPTGQLAVFILLEDITWPNWKQWLGPNWEAEKPRKPHPTPAEIAQAVDAIAFARLAAPNQKFAILADEDLKRLAVRNPWARGKAMAIYGLTVEDAITGDPSLPPDLGKLLHTSPNDNCPICRQRAKPPTEIP